MKKKISIGLVGLALALSLSACGNDRKAAQISDEILARMDEVKSYRVELTMATDGKSDLYSFDIETETGNLRFHQEQAENQVLDLIRLDGKDYMSVDGGERYMPVQHQSVGLVHYRALCGILVPLKYESNEDDDSLHFSGFDKQIFESLKSAFSLSFKDFSDSDFNFEIEVTPSADGRYLSTIKADIKAEQGDRRTEVTLVAALSEINQIKPIALPDGTPEHPADEATAKAEAATATADPADEVATNETEVDGADQAEAAETGAAADKNAAEADEEAA